MMLLSLLAGMPVMVLCLVLQAIFLAKALRHYVRLRVIHQQGASQSPQSRLSHLWEIVMLATVMLVMLIGNFAQTAIWATLFLVLGEFDDFPTALYHSAVNFSTLGYGDIILSERWRLLGPLEASNGILMFGVSTSVMTAAVLDVIKDNLARLRADK